MRKILMVAMLAALGLISGRAQAVIVQYQANMTGAQETPPNGSPGTGTVNFDFDTVSNVLTLTSGNYMNMLATVTASHIHNGPPGVAGPIIIPLANTGGLSGTLSMPPTALTAAQVTALQAGNLYVNVHTSQFPGGEIRGQILAIPAPGALALLGLAGLTARRRRR